jgi:aminomethyltransferase
VHNHCAKIPAGGIRYSLLCREDGHALDDLLIYREESGVYLVVNASNTERDLAWIRSHAGGLAARYATRPAATAMLALQGPRSQAILQRIARDIDLASLGYYRFGFRHGRGAGAHARQPHGLHGEDGLRDLPARRARARVCGELQEAALPRV